VQGGGLPRATGESGVGSGSPVAFAGLLVEESQRAVGEDIGERVHGERRSARWSGLVGEVSASRRLPAQRSAEAQRAGAVEDLECGIEQLLLLAVELLALISPVDVLAGGDGEGRGAKSASPPVKSSQNPLDREGGPSLARISSGQGLVEVRAGVGEDAAVAASAPATATTASTDRLKRKRRQAPLPLATGAFGCPAPPKPLAAPGSARRVSDLLRLPRGPPERGHAGGDR